MKHLLRPYLNLRRSGPVALAAAVICLIAAPRALDAQAKGVMSFFANPFPSLARTSQGYLGVDLGDVDQDKAQQLKLKDVKGAVITLIDHDAPAGKIGLKVNDVIVSLNGQSIEGAEQLKRMLREIPAGRKVSLEISRDGNIQTLAVELADREAMEHDVWDKMEKDGDLISPAPGMGILGANGDVSAPPGFHMPFLGSTLKVGAIVEPLTSQMAEYLGVNGGLMVKQVAKKSEAANAGLHAFDVILKVGADPINTAADWERSLRSNEGKQVQVTILRDKKQQTLNLQVDSKRHSELEILDLFGGDSPEFVAENDDLVPCPFADDDAAEQQAEQLPQSIKPDGFGPDDFKIDPKQMEQLKQQMEQFKKEFNSDEFKQQMDQFKLDPKAMQDLQDQMNLFKIDPKQMQQLQQQMEQFKKNFNSDEFRKQFQMNQKQREQLDQQMKQFQRQFKDQMDNWREQGSGHFV
ncbi:MAG TPA: PDZ domain-containing protein [Terracidiphilus sp.]|nr:PDZ domain-containing protein [Terracidiphilus sp.]